MDRKISKSDKKEKKTQLLAGEQYEGGKVGLQHSDSGETGLTKDEIKEENRRHMTKGILVLVAGSLWMALLGCQFMYS